MIVLDASLTLARFHSVEVTPAVIAVFEAMKTKGAWVPLLWRIEVANVLQRNVRRGLYEEAFRDETLADLSQLNIQVDTESPDYLWSSTVNLAHSYKLSVYDATYLEIAIRRGLPLATLDNDLRVAAQKAGVPLLGL